MDAPQAFPYPIAPRTLKKWNEKFLARSDLGNGTIRFAFTYHGSTCNNGGTPFSAVLHADIAIQGASPVVESAWIEIPADQREAASKMCAAPGEGPEDAGPFFEALAAPADFIGRTLDETILEDRPQNFAGCFCGKPHVNQKWTVALSTMRFALTEGP